MIRKLNCIIIALCVFFCLQGCKQATKASLKKGAKETVQEVIEKSAKKTSKTTILTSKKITKETLPAKRKALAVVKDKTGRIVPEINNLNANAVNYPDAINKQLLKIRRKAISPYDQFPTMAQLKSYDIKKLYISDEPSADLLRRNLYIAMNSQSVDICKGFGGTAAHHVIEGTDKYAAKSRAILRKFNININAPENGILLPDGENSIYKGCMHRTSHTPEYSEYVYDKIKDAKSRDELIAFLLEIKHELYQGKLNLQGPAQGINKNIL